MDRPAVSPRAESTPPTSQSTWSPQKRLVLDPIFEHGNDDPPPNRSSHRSGTLVMLHGWAQNTHVFLSRSKKLVKRLRKAGYRLVFLQAPHRLPPKKVDTNNPSSQPSREYAYAWFVYNPDDPAADSTPIPSSTGEYAGMDQSLELIRQEVDQLRQEDSTQAPIVLLGFSQGAVLVHKIATLLWDANCGNSGSLSNTWKIIEKCILVSGFPFQANMQADGKNDVRSDEDHHAMSIPSLHVVGTNDCRVSPSLTRQVYLQEPCFRGKYSVWEHDRGHVIPTDQAFCNCLLDFLASNG